MHVGSTFQCWLDIYQVVESLLACCYSGERRWRLCREAGLRASNQGHHYAVETPSRKINSILPSLVHRYLHSSSIYFCLFLEGRCTAAITWLTFDDILFYGSVHHLRCELIVLNICRSLASAHLSNITSVFLAGQDGHHYLCKRN
jgi:hypothetical protein